VQYRIAFIALTLGALVVYVFSQPPIAQPLSYHDFADTRLMWGISNALNVLSNIPFLAVGAFGLLTVLGTSERRAMHFDEPWTRLAYAVFFAGVSLTTFGSAYYHLAPSNARLVWDRVPMTLGFMGLLTAILAERVDVRLGKALLVPLLLFGVGSVFYWYWTETQGRGDLRWYLWLVQFGSLIVVTLVIVLFPARYRGTAYLVAGLVGYAGAKWFEAADREIFGVGRVSGHTVKHLVAAGAVLLIVAMLRSRDKPIAGGATALGERDG
jgi:hypothetical protein